MNGCYTTSFILIFIYYFWILHVSDLYIGLCFMFVCFWRALLPFNVNRFRWNLVTRTLLWSSLAATIIVQIVRRGTARRKNSNFKILVHHFFASVSPMYCKQFDSIRTKLTEEIHFEVCPYRHNASMDAKPPSNVMRPPQALCARFKHQCHAACP